METAIDAGALRDKLAVLGNDSYTAETCERYAGMIAEIKQSEAGAARGRARA